MEAHDKLKAGIKYDYPSPDDVPKFYAAFDAMLEALKRQKAAWKNILELNLLPEVHRQSAIFLCDGANAAIAHAEKVK